MTWALTGGTGYSFVTRLAIIVAAGESGWIAFIRYVSGWLAILACTVGLRRTHLGRRVLRVSATVISATTLFGFAALVYVYVAGPFLVLVSPTSIVLFGIGGVDSAELISWSAPFVVTVLVLFLAWIEQPRHLVGDPPHCERCGYSLKGNTSGVCPECGAAQPSISPAPAKRG